MPSRPDRPLAPRPPPAGRPGPGRRRRGWCPGRPPVERWDVALVVAVGGAVGGLARYALNQLVGTPAGAFPWATFAENVLGCLLLGALMVVLVELRAAESLRAARSWASACSAASPPSRRTPPRSARSPRAGMPRRPACTWPAASSPACSPRVAGVAGVRARSRRWPAAPRPARSRRDRAAGRSGSGRRRTGTVVGRPARTAAGRSRLPVGDAPDQRPRARSCSASCSARPPDGRRTSSWRCSGQGSAAGSPRSARSGSRPFRLAEDGELRRGVPQRGGQRRAGGRRRGGGLGAGDRAGRLSRRAWPPRGGADLRRAVGPWRSRARPVGTCTCVGTEAAMEGHAPRTSAVYPLGLRLRGRRVVVVGGRRRRAAPGGGPARRRAPSSPWSPRSARRPWPTWRRPGG